MNIQIDKPADRQCCYIFTNRRLNTSPPLAIRSRYTPCSIPETLIRYNCDPSLQRFTEHPCTRHRQNTSSRASGSNGAVPRRCSTPVAGFGKQTNAAAAPSRDPPLPYCRGPPAGRCAYNRTPPHPAPCRSQTRRRSPAGRTPPPSGSGKNCRARCRSSPMNCCCRGA